MPLNNPTPAGGGGKALICLGFNTDTVGGANTGRGNLGTKGLDFSSEANTQVNFQFACTLKNMWIRVKANSANNTTTIKLRINGSDGNQVLSVTTTQTGEFIDTSNTDAIVASDLVNYETSRSAGTGTYQASQNSIEVAS